MTLEPATHHAPAGQILFRAGDECSGFVNVLSGTIRVTLNTPSGKEIVLYRVEPGQICLQTFACITQGRTYAAEGIAETDVTFELIPPSKFDSFMQYKSDFRAQIYSAIADRFSDFEHIVQGLAFSGLDIRVADVILRLADNADNLAITHEKLAHEIGSAREAITRQLSQFAKNGLISLSRGHIHILDRSKLKNIATTDL